MPQYKILIVDDDVSNLSTYKRIFDKLGYETTTADRPQKAFELYRNGAFDVVLCDIQMPGMTGNRLMENCLKIKGHTPFVFVTAFGTINLAVNLLRSGAFHFLTKPVVKAQLIKTVEDALTQARSKNIIVPASPLDHNCIGQNPKFLEILTQATIAAKSDSSILIRGESGTGKELIANLIHQKSSRAKERLITINCSAIPENLIEAELFGVTKGAFTGANTNKAGRIELAHCGTLFLDEIGELSPTIQIKLLRILQEGTFERLGSTQTQKSNFRLISATHNDLETAVAEGRFREDLFYRIHVINFEIPPLRKRIDDIPLLTNHFITSLSKKLHRPVPQLTPEAIEILRHYEWPGNVRQLQNVLEQALVFCGDQISVHHLKLTEKSQNSWKNKTVSIPIGTPLRDIEKKVILDTLEATNFDKELTASLLGTTVRTLYRHFKEWREENAESKNTTREVKY